MAFQKLKRNLWYRRKEFWRSTRILFPSPAEVHFIRLMGGRAITIDMVKYPKTRFPLTIIYKRGRVLAGNYMQREVRVGGMYVDFAFVDPYTKKAIEIDGSDYHKDIVREQSRDEYLKSRGWILMHIQAMNLYRQPGKVQRDVLAFLAR